MQQPMFQHVSALSDDRPTRVKSFKHLTKVVLPALARSGRWPIRLDHCFKRICLDYAFEDVWYHHLRRPAERHLEGASLLRAVQCAEELAEGGLPLLTKRNAASLRYRGKLRSKLASEKTRTDRESRSNELPSAPHKRSSRR